MPRRKMKSYFIILTIVLFLVMVLGLSIGFMNLSLSEVIKTLFGQGTDHQKFIIWTLRMPRVLMTIILGMALGVSGNVLQTVTKNDLADPGVLGINAGAGLGVTIAYMTMDFNHYNIVYVLPVLGFIGAMGTFSITMFMAKNRDGSLNIDKLILVGIGSAISFSGAMIVFISSAGREDVQFISKWLSGNIWGDKWPFVLVSGVTSILLIAILYFKANNLNIMALDDVSATSLGVDLKKERNIFVITAVALSSIVVSVAGAISFVGLIIPHLAKKIFGPKHQYNLIGTMLLGSVFLTTADIIGRNILQPQGLLPGIVVSIIGAPYFLYLIIKKQS